MLEDALKETRLITNITKNAIASKILKNLDAILLFFFGVLVSTETASVLFSKNSSFNSSSDIVTRLPSQCLLLVLQFVRLVVHAHSVKREACTPCRLTHTINMAALSVDSLLSLNDGTSIRVFGLGVYESQLNGETEGACLAAFKHGYRMIDTAAIYK